MYAPTLPRPRTHRRRIVALAVLTATLLVPAATAAAQQADPDRPADPPVVAPVADAAAPVPDAQPAPELSPGLEDVAVSSPEADRAQERRDAIRTDLDETVRIKNESGTLLLELARRDLVLTTQIDDAKARVKRATALIASLRRQLRDLAVANYVSGTNSDGEQQAQLDLDVQESNRLGTQRVLAGTVSGDKQARLRAARRALAKAQTDLELTTAVRDGVRATIEETKERRIRAAADEIRLGGELFVAQDELHTAQRLAMVDGTDFPLVVLDAYVRAADSMALLAPGCKIPWWALAGIGRTESRHGTFGGAEVRRDGSLTKPILGIPLDGRPGIATVGGPGGFDRAQGPMQFITSTWARWYRDGNGDGVADAQNLYDAALGAAAYLCFSGPLDTDDGLRRAYFSYNHSLEYVQIVLDRAHGYAEALPLPPRPAPQP